MQNESNMAIKNSQLPILDSRFRIGLKDKLREIGRKDNARVFRFWEDLCYALFLAA